VSALGSGESRSTFPQEPQTRRRASDAWTRRRGYLNPTVIVRLAFWTMTLCILVAVVASVLAIWQYTGTDVLWRTVATCAVIGAGTLTFSWITGLFDPDDR
jgi:hypothetical protein